MLNDDNLESSLYNPNPARHLIAAHTDLEYPYLTSFGEAHLQIDSGVFCPTLTNTSKLLLEAVEFLPGERVLDVFAGSGALGINASLHGASCVVMVDIDSSAVRCATTNVRLNGLETSAKVRQGTLTSCLSPSEKFDLIIANPPLLPGDQVGPLSVAIFDPGLRSTVDFLRSVGDHLASRGRIYLITSSVIESYGHDVDRLSRESGLESAVVRKSDHGYETYRVHKIVRSLGG